MDAVFIARARKDSDVHRHEDTRTPSCWPNAGRLAPGRCTGYKPKYHSVDKGEDFGKLSLDDFSRSEPFPCIKPLVGDTLEAHSL
jgi:hypothetical protein